LYVNHFLDLTFFTGKSITSRLRFARVTGGVFCARVTEGVISEISSLLTSSSLLS